MDKPQPKISQVTSYGTVKIIFDSKMFQFDETKPDERRLEANTVIIETLKEESMVEVEFVDEAESDVPRNVEFEWEIILYSETAMEIQLDFEDPLQVSSS